MKRNSSVHPAVVFSKSIHFLICAIAFGWLCGAVQAQATAEEFIKRGKELARPRKSGRQKSTSRSHLDWATVEISNDITTNR